MTPKPLNAQSLRRRSGLAQVRLFSRLRSTQDKAVELIEAEALPLPAAVLAARQTAGRGQGANAWWSPPDSLAVTFAFAAQDAAETTEAAHALPLRVGLALRQVIAQYVAPQRLRLKWPNDLLADGKKLAGVLCQRVRQTDLIGIGVNVSGDFTAAPPEVRRRAVSLQELGVAAPSRQDLFVGLAIALREDLEQASPQAGWNEELNQVHALHAKVITVQMGNQVLHGRCEGVDANGALLVREGTTLHRVISGRVQD